MKKHIANIISLSRIIGATILFFLNTISGMFITVYIYCGFSDFIDGPIARKLGSTSVLGTCLDTTGDVLTYLALTKILFLQGLVPFWAIIWFLIAMAGCLLSAVISKIRHGKFYFIHSLFGKVLGFCLFILPFIMILINNTDIWIGVVCCVASIAALESIYIQAKSQTLITNIISLKQIFNL